MIENATWMDELDNRDLWRLDWWTSVRCDGSFDCPNEPEHFIQVTLSIGVEHWWIYCDQCLRDKA
jgi:hypothetical protein